MDRLTFDMVPQTLVHNIHILDHMHCIVDQVLQKLILVLIYMIVQPRSNLFHLYNRRFSLWDLEHIHTPLVHYKEN